MQPSPLLAAQLRTISPPACRNPQHRLTNASRTASTGRVFPSNGSGLSGPRIGQLGRRRIHDYIVIRLITRLPHRSADETASEWLLTRGDQLGDQLPSPAGPPRSAGWGEILL
ncbi:hypothetical protein VTI74DRAFT_8153 [Chaetomium olivicolor]